MRVHTPERWRHAIGSANAFDFGRKAPYRLYEVQNGNHIETYQDAFPQLEPIEPHAHAAFSALVAHLESHVPLPPDQCVPRGGAIAQQPARAGHYTNLLAP